MNKQDEYLLIAFKSLGEIINHKNTEISVLNYELERAKEKLNKIENHLDKYNGGTNEKGN